jgi:hypothetical protein
MPMDTLKYGCGRLGYPHGRDTNCPDKGQIVERMACIVMEHLAREALKGRAAEEYSEG